MPPCLVCFTFIKQLRVDYWAGVKKFQCENRTPLAKQVTSIIANFLLQMFNWILRHEITFILNVWPQFCPTSFRRIHLYLRSANISQIFQICAQNYAFHFIPKIAIAKSYPLLANVSSIYKREPSKQSVLFVSPKNFTNCKVVYFLNDVGPIVEPKDCQLRCSGLSRNPRKPKARPRSFDLRRFEQFL